MRLRNTGSPDISGDGIVNMVDIAALLIARGTSDATANLDGNGVVDGLDLALVLAGWS